MSASSTRNSLSDSKPSTDGGRPVQAPPKPRLPDPFLADGVAPDEHVAAAPDPNAEGAVTALVAHKPVSTMAEEVRWECENVTIRAEAHDRIARFWERMSSLTRMAVSLTAGVSALSIVADNMPLATAFALITALVTALNAGFSPSVQARQHRAAARGYSHLQRPLNSLAEVLQGAVECAEGGWRSTLRLTEKRALWREAMSLESRVEALTESSPPLSTKRIFSTREEMAKLWRKPSAGWLSASTVPAGGLPAATDTLEG